MSLAADQHTGVPSRPVDKSGVTALVQQALAGSREAFDEIVFLYRDQVYATCWQLTRNSEDSMDVSQEVFLRAYRALSSYKGNAQFSTWLHRIIVNTCIDYLRKERRHRQNTVSLDQESDEDSPSPKFETSIDPKQREVVYQQQIQTRVQESLASLSGRQRQVFILRYYQDLNLKEISETIRCSEGAVKRHLHRAQLRLRELLRDMRTK